MREKANLPIAFASVLLSVMLWLVVYAQTVPEPKPVNAPLTLDGLDEAHYFLRKVPNDVRLTVSAPADRKDELDDERVTASVDLSAPRNGLHDYPVVVSPDWVRRFLEDPHPTVRIDVEPVASRIVKVQTMVKGVLHDRNLVIASRRLSPLEVTVRGPASEVALVDEVRAYLDLSQIDPLNQEAQESELVPLDARGSRPQHVRTTPSVALNYFKLVPTEATKPAQVVPDLDVTYDASVLPDGYRLDPTTVSLSGKPAVLANVSKVPTGIVRVRGLARTRTFRVRLLPPPGTTIVESPEVEVTILTRPAPTLPKSPITTPATEPPPASSGTDRR